MNHPIGTIVTDVNILSYQKILDERKVTESISDAEIWDAVPADPDYVFTPTLQWQMHPEQTPTFNRLKR